MREKDGSAWGRERTTTMVSGRPRELPGEGGGPHRHLSGSYPARTGDFSESSMASEKRKWPIACGAGGKRGIGIEKEPVAAGRRKGIIDPEEGSLGAF